MPLFCIYLSTVKNFSVAVLAFKSSHGRVLFHIKVFLGPVLIWTLMDLKRPIFFVLIVLPNGQICAVLQFCYSLFTVKKTFLYQFLLSKSSHGRVLFHIKVFLQYWFEHSALWVKFFCKKMPHFSSFCNQKKFLSTIYRFTKIVFLFLTTIDQKQGNYFLRFFLFLFPQPEP